MPPVMKAGEDLRGVRRGSRIVPLLVVAVSAAAFVASAVALHRPTVVLVTVARQADVPAEGRNLYVVARVQGDEANLHFRIFDASGTQRAQRTIAPVSAFSPLATITGHWDQTPLDLSPPQQDAIIATILSLTGYQLSVRDIGTYAGMWLHTVSSDLMRNLPAIAGARLETLGLLVLYAIVPGLFGLSYRRAFWPWFTGAFLILCAINWAFEATNAGSIAHGGIDAPWTLGFFQLIEEIVVLGLVAFRLRRHSVWPVTPPDRRRAFLLAGALAVLASAVLWAFVDEHAWRAVEGAALLFALAIVFVTQTRVAPQAAHGKNIVVCIDGTWNQPGQKDFDRVAVTNVFKLFRLCKGEASREHVNASQFKVYGDAGGPTQIALYYRGVGNRIDNSALGELFGGAFGMGADAIVERAYLDVVKAYRPGDRIFVVGFSRGAAIARLVAGAIGRRGVPRSVWTLRLFGRLWLIWKSSRALDVKVDVLGCWDTVGSFGLAKNILGIPFQRINLLKDLSVSLCVKRAYHMLALDETRDAFVPTLMEPDPTAPDRIVEVWFSGNHSNVGGGYATDNLSDVSLDFFLRHVSSGYASNPGQTPGDESWGLYLHASSTAADTGADSVGAHTLNPDPRGAIRHSSGPVYAYAPRTLPTHAVIHDAVFDRLHQALPVYAPQSLFDLNRDLVQKRTEIETEANRLVETGSLDEEASRKILSWSAQHQTLLKWSQYPHRLTPAAELPNPPAI